MCRTVDYSCVSSGKPLLTAINYRYSKPKEMLARVLAVERPSWERLVKAEQSQGVKPASMQVHTASSRV